MTKVKITSNPSEVSEYNYIKRIGVMLQKCRFEEEKTDLKNKIKTLKTDEEFDKFYMEFLNIKEKDKPASNEKANKQKDGTDEKQKETKAKGDTRVFP